MIWSWTLSWALAAWLSTGDATEEPSTEHERPHLSVPRSATSRSVVRSDLYLEDAPERRAVAQLDSTVVGRELHLVIRSMGDGIAPIVGVEGIDGVNLRTARELDAILRNGRLSFTRNGLPVAWRCIAIDRAPLPRRVVTRHGHVLERQVTGVDLPRSVHLRVPCPDAWKGTVTLCVDGRARWTLTWNGRSEPTAAVSLGTGFFADVPAGELVAQRFALARRAAAARPSRRIDDTPSGMTEDAWQSLDRDGRWLAYLDDSERASRIDRWQAFLIAQQDADVLEWIALYDGKPAAVEALRTLDDARWIPCAVWLMRQPSSHDLENACDLLKRDPARALAWIDAYPEWKVERVATVVDSLERPDDDTMAQAQALPRHPPYEPEDVLSALHPPAALVERNVDGPHDLDGVALHHVIRALSGLVHSGLRDASWIDAVTELTRHPHEVVRRRAYLTFTELPADCTPRERFLADLHDPDADAVGAVWALAEVRVVEVDLALHDIALQPEHPAWETTLERLASLGDAWTSLLLDDVAVRDRHAQRRLMDVRARLDERIAHLQQVRAADTPDEKSLPTEDQLLWWIERAVVAVMNDHPLAASVDGWTRSWMLGWARIPGVAQRLRTLRDTAPERLGPEAGRGTDARVDAVRRFIDDLAVDE